MTRGLAENIPDEIPMFKGCYVPLYIFDKLVWALIDTGASVSVIDEDLVEQTPRLKMNEI